eukprot:3823342-Rhodomonas_salina.1
MAAAEGAGAAAAGGAVGFWWWEADMWCALLFLQTDGDIQLPVAASRSISEVPEFDDLKPCIKAIKDANPDMGVAKVWHG